MQKEDPVLCILTTNKQIQSLFGTRPRTNPVMVQTYPNQPDQGENKPKFDSTLLNKAGVNTLRGLQGHLPYVQYSFEGTTWGSV